MIDLPPQAHTYPTDQTFPECESGSPLSVYLGKLCSKEPGANPQYITLDTYEYPDGSVESLVKNQNGGFALLTSSGAILPIAQNSISPRFTNDGQIQYIDEAVDIDPDIVPVWQTLDNYHDQIVHTVTQLTTLEFNGETYATYIDTLGEESTLMITSTDGTISKLDLLANHYIYGNFSLKVVERDQTQNLALFYTATPISPDLPDEYGMLVFDQNSQTGAIYTQHAISGSGRIDQP